MSKMGQFLTSEKTKESLWKITEYVANGIGIAIPIVAVVLNEKKRKREANNANWLSDMFSTMDYDSTISVIMSSNLLDSRKVQAMGLIKKDQQQSYYKTINSILKSNLIDSRKIEAIEKFNDN